MRPVVVVDASVSVTWFIPRSPEEKYAEQALALLKAYADDRIELYQPPVWQAEVLGVLSRVAPGDAERHAWRLLSFDCASASSSSVYLKAVQLSVQLGHHLFDTIYHAAALSHSSAVLITADKRYLGKAKTLGRILPLERWEEVFG
ncbi:MAG: PIN domain-containing protein [Deltaproteobacteria bacterium]|nr:PIN domain-containing protein [Deltaproteobacteria bacterium]